MYLFSAGSAFLLGFVIFINADRANRIANRWFSLFLLSAAFALTGYFIWHSDITPKSTFLIIVSEVTRFILAPALYLSIWHFTHPQKIKAIIMVLHLLPAFLFLVFSLSFLLMSSDFFDVSQPFIPGHLLRLFGRVMAYIIPLQFFIYWIASFLLLRRHRLQVFLFASNVQDIDLKWLCMLLWIITSMMVVWFSQIFLKSNPLNDYAVYGYLSIIYLLAYFLLTQKEVFPMTEIDKAAIQGVLETQRETIPTKSRRLSEDEVLHLKQSLNHLLTKDKVFAKEGIDLPQLARYMNIPVNDLSFVINDGYQMNFFSLINSHRIDEAKVLLLSPAYRHLSVLGVAFEVGFSSKTTFNAAFKKHTGQTPSEFIKNSQMQ